MRLHIFGGGRSLFFDYLSIVVIYISIARYWSKSLQISIQTTSFWQYLTYKYHLVTMTSRRAQCALDMFLLTNYKFLECYWCSVQCSLRKYYQNFCTSTKSPGSSLWTDSNVPLLQFSSTRYISFWIRKSGNKANNTFENSPISNFWRYFFSHISVFVLRIQLEKYQCMDTDAGFFFKYQTHRSNIFY